MHANQGQDPILQTMYNKPIQPISKRFLIARKQLMANQIFEKR